jgi:hypothetical protein
MMKFIHPRLRKPLLRGIAGLGLAGAWAIGGGHARWLAIVIAIVVIGNSVGWYLWAGNDSDDGALLGSRADERQRLVGQKSRALAGVVAIAATYTGLLITLAVKRADAWPFAALFAVTGFAYLLGLSSYGSGEPDPADDADAGHEERSRVSH